MKASRLIRWTAWEDQWAGVLSTVDAPDDTPAPEMPVAQWIVLPSASTSTSNTTADAEAGALGEKRKASTGDSAASKKKGQSEGHRIHTVLTVGDFTGPTPPTVEDIEGAILKRQKGESSLLYGKRQKCADTICAQPSCCLSIYENNMMCPPEFPSYSFHIL